MRKHVPPPPRADRPMLLSEWADPRQRARYVSRGELLAILRIAFEQRSLLGRLRRWWRREGEWKGRAEGFFDFFRVRKPE